YISICSCVGLAVTQSCAALFPYTTLFRSAFLVVSCCFSSRGVNENVGLHPQDPDISPFPPQTNDFVHAEVPPAPGNDKFCCFVLTGPRYHPLSITNQQFLPTPAVGTDHTMASSPTTVD